MAWRVAKSLATLRDQINAMAPNRSKASDGTVGNLAHQKTKSEHNPNAAGVVRAMDITHDPAHGFDSWKFADMLRLRNDPRVYYIISNGRIAAPTIQNNAWRKYNGANKHDHHVHISVVASASGYDDPRPWDIGGDWNTAPNRPQPSVPAGPPLLLEGSRGDWVSKLQKLLKMDVQDGIFGPKTKKAVMDFQKAKKLVADGVVGTYTWEALGQ